MIAAGRHWNVTMALAYGVSVPVAAIPENVDGLVVRRALQLQAKGLAWSPLDNRKRCLSPPELETKYGQRRECARQIHAMSRYFDTMSPAVFASSMVIMDSALLKVNIPWKYLSCFSAACFFIGSKWIEDEYQPSISVLTELHYKQWKEVDLRRMEEKVLQVLGWEMPRCTYLNFIHPLNQLMQQHHPPHHLPPVSHVLRNAELLMMKEFSSTLKPAAVALGALQYTLHQCRAWTPSMSATMVTLQDFLQVLDSELHEIDEILTAEDQDQHRELKSNKAYFPKVFELPYDSFCPDYRLHKITEECDEPELNQKPSVDCLLGSDTSVSDYDYSDDGESPGSPCETTADNFKAPSDCTLFKDYILEESYPGGEVNRQDECSDDTPDCEPFESTALDSDSSQNILEQQSSTTQTSSEVQGSNSNEQQFHQEKNDEHDDSGCEEGDGSDDEQDSCGEHGRSEQDVCSEPDSSEQDSGCDQDSDFHDSSPCRVCFVKAGVSQLQGQAGVSQLQGQAGVSQLQGKALAFS